MQNFDASMLTGALEMVTNADAKNTAKAELKYQVENSQDMADVRALKTSLSQIQFFVSSVNQYTAGVQTLRTVPTPQRMAAHSWLQAPRPCMTA